MKLIINSADDLAQLHTLNSWLKRPLIRFIRLNHPTQESGLTKKKTEKKLKFLFNDCGCFWASPAFLITFATLYIFILKGQPFNWLSFIICLGAAIAAAFIAKFTALALSYHRLNRLIHKLEASAKLIKGEDITCLAQQ